MTSSNETSRRSRTYTFVAGVLATLVFIALGALIYEVNDLNDRYGRIAEDIGYYSGERERLASERDALSAELGRA